MRAPTGNTGGGKQRGKQILRDLQHLVNQTGVQIYVGAHHLVVALYLGKHLRGQLLHILQGFKLFFKSGLISQLAGIGF